MAATENTPSVAPASGHKRPANAQQQDSATQRSGQGLGCFHRPRRTSRLSQTHSPDGQQQATTAVESIKEDKTFANALPAGSKTMREESDDMERAVGPVGATNVATAMPNPITAASSTLCSSPSIHANEAPDASRATSTDSTRDNAQPTITDLAIENVQPNSTAPAIENTQPSKKSSLCSLNRKPRTTRKVTPASSTYSSPSASNSASNVAMPTPAASGMISGRRACDAPGHNY
ncbi:MAG: hypothetical protein Q9220_003372 [cf. Caloplaca sp. 1 TL-2023]